MKKYVETVEQKEKIIDNYVNKTIILIYAKLKSM